MANSVFIGPFGFINNGTNIIFPLPGSFPSGTLALPGVAFTSDTSTGLHLSAASVLKLQVGGLTYLELNGLNGDSIFNGVNGARVALNTNGAIYFMSKSALSSLADGQFVFTNNAASAGVGLDFATDGVLRFRGRTLTSGIGSLDIGAKIIGYNAVAAVGWGVPAIYGYGDVVAATNIGTASIASYMCGAADGTFQVSGNVLVTTATTHSFSLDCTYTDESNVARTLVIPVAQLAGTFITSGLITNITGAGPYESATMTIRVKASTLITVRTSAGGTFTTVVYNARAAIQQIS